MIDLRCQKTSASIPDVNSTAELRPDFIFELLHQIENGKLGMRDHAYQVDVLAMLPMVAASIHISLVEVEEMPLGRMLDGYEQVAIEQSPLLEHLPDLVREPLRVLR